MTSAMNLPVDARRALRVYNLLFPFALLAMLPGLLARMFRRGNFRARFGQRVGLFSAEDQERLEAGGWIWIHSISVGETLVALKLARQLRQLDPAAQIVLSTTTSTGFALASEAQSDWLEAIYNPVDLLPIVRRTLALLRPTQLVLIEGEAWPNLVAECVRRGIPVALVNARLSPRSEARFRRFRVWSGPVFRLLGLICVPEAADVPRWESIGAARDRIRCTGSIKFDEGSSGAPSREEEFRALLAPLGVEPQTPIIVAGSTWAPEETALVEALVELRREIPDLFLIIVPRHVERTADLVRGFAPLGARIVRRSALPATGPFDVLLVDVTGELRDWYRLATAVFVGKSLPGVSATGGQNPAEPAALGKPVVFGPHMENFSSVVELLLTNEAAIQVADKAELVSAMRLLLSDGAARERMGSAAQRALTVHLGATERTARALMERVRAPASPP